jgi:galactonate dehydratase
VGVQRISFFASKMRMLPQRWTAVQRASQLKITEIKTFVVPPRWLFLKIETDEGISGWGEAVLEGRADTVAAAVAELSQYLIGLDPSPIEDHWTVLYRGGFYRGGGIHMSALAGIDQALWDIKGKTLGISVCKLLGGPVRDRIQVYSWIGGDRPSHVGENAKDAMARGFRAIKMNACEEMNYIDSNAKIDAAVANVAAIREMAGNELGIGIDFHGRVHRPMAKTLIRELEPFRPMFIEEPVLSEHAEALADIVSNTSIPIALGERLFSRWDFKKILQDGHVDIIQPDPSHSGGITETKKIAAMAECHDVALALHCPLGPIALAACLQLDGVCQNAVIQEQSLGIHYNKANDLLDYLVDPKIFEYVEGYVSIPDGPGLGIEINEEYVRDRARIGHKWRNPIWRHADGSFAEW